MLKVCWRKVQISDDDKKVIYHARKSLLYNEGSTRMKKGRLFDVTMGTYDGVEACKLVGTLDKIRVKYKNSIGLYRDDLFSVLKNKSGTQLKRIKKSLQKTVKDFGLEILAESNWRILNYLDVTLNLDDSYFKLYHKTDDVTQYFSKESNHSPYLMKHL